MVGVSTCAALQPTSHICAAAQQPCGQPRGVAVKLPRPPARSSALCKPAVQSSSSPGRKHSSSLWTASATTTTSSTNGSNLGVAGGGSATSSSGSSAASRTPGTGGSGAAAATCRIRPCEAEDYWAAADLHCSAFYPRATPFWFSALRLDRVMSLQIGKERQDLGRFLCLIAEAPDPPSSSSSGSSQEHGGGAEALSAPSSHPASSAQLKTWQGALQAPWEGDRVDLGPLVDALVALFFPPYMRHNYASTYSAAGLRGAVVVDTLGEHVPRKRQQLPNGTVREVRRTAIAYLSNLAVAPCKRRAGIGRQLLREAEKAAAAWGCRSMALHVDPTNTAAMRMYRSAGYRPVLEQPEWQRWLEGRQKPLVLMMRALPRQSAAAAAAAGAEAAAANVQAEAQQKQQERSLAA